MSFYNKPWSPGYALPAYVKKEDPLTRGSARTTPWLPSGTISKVPKGSRHGGYAVPSYVLAEPVGSQAHTTPWLPRGTVSSMKGIKTGLPWVSNAHTLDSNGLGALGSTQKSKSSVGGSDPIEQYGKKAAAAVVAVAPVGNDKKLKSILDQIDPKLFASVKLESKKLREVGMNSRDAYQKGIATAFTYGLLKEFMRMGKLGRAPKPGVGKGQVSLGALVGFEAQGSNYSDLGGILDTIKNTVNKIGGYACDVATHPITPIAAGAGGAYMGGPTGASTAMAGAGVAASICSGGVPAGGGYAPARGGAPSWALPAMIGGGALALFLVLR